MEINELNKSPFDRLRANVTAARLLEDVCGEQAG